ncbi:MAG: hypothetical protein ABIA83_02680 [Patescibacteria group bacterium]
MINTYTVLKIVNFDQYCLTFSQKPPTLTPWVQAPGLDSNLPKTPSPYCTAVEQDMDFYQRFKTSFNNSDKIFPVVGTCAAVAVLLIGLSLFITQGKIQDSSEPLGCDTRAVQTDLANAYGRVMDIHRLCAMIDSDEPIAKPCETPVRTRRFNACQLEKILNAWADEAYQQVEVACRQDISCFGQANVSRAYDGTPLLK